MGQLGQGLSLICGSVVLQLDQGEGGKVWFGYWVVWYWEDVSFWVVWWWDLFDRLEVLLYGFLRATWEVGDQECV